MSEPKLRLIYKPTGKTPYQTLEQLRKVEKDLATKKLTYVGRLDPYARGLQPIVVNPTKEFVEELKGLDKVYNCTILWGISTDTYDPLGIISYSAEQDHLLVDSDITDVISSSVGIQNQPYPPYSAIKVNGKPLHYWAKNNLLDQIKIPSHTIEVVDITLHNHVQIRSKQLIEIILDKINITSGDFRQTTIIENWEKWYMSRKNQSFLTTDITITCSSGTYIRQLCHSWGETLGIGGLCFDLERTHVGPYSIQQAKHIYE